MPASFLKPIDYSIDLLIKTHPTLRAYCKQLEATEIDPAYHIYPSVKERLQPKDEIQLRNIKTDDDRSFISTLTKSIAGTFIN